MAYFCRTGLLNRVNISNLSTGATRIWEFLSHRYSMIYYSLKRHPDYASLARLVYPSWVRCDRPTHNWKLSFRDKCFRIFLKVRFPFIIAFYIWYCYSFRNLVIYWYFCRLLLQWCLSHHSPSPWISRFRDMEILPEELADKWLCETKLNWRLSRNYNLYYHIWQERNRKSFWKML